MANAITGTMTGANWRTIENENFLNLDAQRSIYSYCCYLGKIKSRIIVEEKCNWDIYLDLINIILGFSCNL